MLQLMNSKSLLRNSKICSKIFKVPQFSINNKLNDVKNWQRMLKSRFQILRMQSLFLFWFVIEIKMAAFHSRIIIYLQFYIYYNLEKRNPEVEFLFIMDWLMGNTSSHWKWSILRVRPLLYQTDISNLRPCWDDISQDINLLYVGCITK